MPVGAGPAVVTVGEPLQLPWSMMAHHVMMTTQRPEIVVVGWTTLSMGTSMIQVALMRRHTTAGKHTSRIVGPDVSFLAGGGTPSQRARRYRGPVVRHDEHPLPIDVLKHNLPGNLGSHRPKTLETARLVTNTFNCRR